MIPLSVVSRVRFSVSALSGVLAFGFSAHAQSPGEKTVVTSETISTALPLTGDGFVIDPDDLAYESASQRNALVVHSGGALTLGNGAVVTVANSSNLTAFMRVGYGLGEDGDGSLAIEDGATIGVGSATRYANFHVGQGAGATGTVMQTGGEFTSIGSFNVGVNGGTGIYSISGGSLIFDHAGPEAANRTSLISIGFNNATGAAGASSGVFNITGGLVDVLPTRDDGVINFIIGNRSLDALAGYNGGVVTTAGPGHGEVNQTGGTLRVGAGAALFLSAYGDGVYNLDGGTLEIGGTSLKEKYGNHTDTTYAFNLGGGTIEVIDSALVTSVDLSLTPGTISTIDTNDLGATFSGNITSAGAHQIDYGGSKLTKTGAGTLTLMTGTRNLDTFAVEAGTVRQESGATTAVELMAGTGSGNSGAYELTGGTLTIHHSTRADDVTIVGGSFRVGDFGGTGTFDQSGGTLNADSSLIIGNRAGTGVYNLSDGTLNVGFAAPAGTSAIFVGRSRAADGEAYSTGTFNLSGGTLNVANGAPFLVGGDSYPIAESANAIGVVNQSGDSIVTVNSYVGLGMNGNGTYNLNGGTLELGGTNGLRQGGGTAAFNFGGGTLRVIGSALTTSVAATFATSTISTVDTNDLAATWSGNLTGAGALRKSGAGSLTLTGAANNLGALQVEQGSVRVTTGATTAGQLLVGATGEDASGTFELTGGTVSTTGSANASFRTSYVGAGSGNIGTVLMSGGTLYIGLPETPAIRADFEVGTFNGTGTMTQSGGDVVFNSTGGLFHIGNQGTGVYNLGAGSITTQNAFAMGRSTTTGLGDGTLNISGGTLTLASSTKGALVVGGVDGSNVVSGGKGTINQTGGTVSVGSYMELATRGGRGVYNLDGGVLQIGGTSGIRYDPHTYGGITGSYEFNLGGGTLRVAGNALTSALAVTLKEETTSTIDTNGIGATFSGVFGGTGGLTKGGAGTLTFSGASTFSGATLVSAGTLVVSGSLANSIVSVGSGATLGGHGSVGGVNVLDGGLIELGGAAGDFAITGDLTLAGTSRTLLYLVEGSNDRLIVGGTLYAGGVLEVALAGSFDLSSGASFDLFDGALNGTFAEVLLPTLGSGLEWNMASFSNGVIAVTASAIPEPGTWAAIVGAVALAAAGWRRRRGRLVARGWRTEL